MSYKAYPDLKDQVITELAALVEFIIWLLLEHYGSARFCSYQLEQYYFSAVAHLCWSTLVKQNEGLATAAVTP